MSRMAKRPPHFMKKIESKLQLIYYMMDKGKEGGGRAAKAKRGGKVCFRGLVKYKFNMSS
jgi:hypothetical protein